MNQRVRKEVVSYQEWRWLIIWAIVILVITTIPYLYGVALSSSTNQFGGFVIGVEDGNSYLAKMQQGRSGYWLFRLVYTPEPHQAELFFLFYILLGKIAGLVNLSNLVVFYLSRLVTIPFGLFAFYYFVAYFIEQIRVRRLALLIFGFTGGLGWLWLVLGGPSELGRMPVDLWVPDASFFLSSLTFTHLPLGQGLLLLLSVASLEFVRSGRRWFGLVAAGCGLGVSLIHPHTLPVISLLLGIYILWQYYHDKKQLLIRFTRLALIALPAVPYLLYVFVVFNRNPAFIAWRLQSLTFSPAPIHYLLGFGLTLLLAMIGLTLTWRRAEPKYRFLYIWTISVPVLVYLPIPLQRRFLDGYQAPLAVLAAVGLVWVIDKVSNHFWRTGFLVLLFMSLTNVLLVTGAMITIAQRPDTVFIASPQAEAARWLAAESHQSIVLASYQTGNYLPTVADVRTFIGHGPETIESETKMAMLSKFFTLDDDNFRRKLLLDYRINYLFYGPAEQALGSFSPATTPYLKNVYDNGTVQIYQVLETEISN